MKKIKVKFINFYIDYTKSYIYKFLKENYVVEISDKPDYIFYSDFGYDHLKYENCVKIYVTGENMVPNFNHCDYAIGFHHLEFEDRYFRCPLYLMTDNYLEIFQIALQKHLNSENYKIRNKFCNMVVSNGLNQSRIDFFKKLSTYKKVDSGGGTLNNIGGKVESKLDFQKQYKFSLAFENSQSNGYTTEKIVDAFASGGIPIYWGDPLIKEIFNSKAFINANDFKTNEELINYIIKVDQDDKLYLSYIKAPMLNNLNYLEEETKKLNNFLFHIFNQKKEDAIRKCSSNHWVIQEKKYYLLSYAIVKRITPLLQLKAKIKNKLIH